MSIDWREIDRARILDREARGLPVYRVSWACNHREHDPTSARGPLKRTIGAWQIQQRFVLRGRATG